jgi:hypothetical protein
MNSRCKNKNVHIHLLVIFFYEIYVFNIIICDDDVEDF